MRMLNYRSSGRGAAWLARLLGVQDFDPLLFTLILQGFQHTFNHNLCLGKGSNSTPKMTDGGQAKSK